MDDLLAPMHIILLLIVALIIFGPKRLPHLGSDLAKGIQSFRKELHRTSSHHQAESDQDQSSSDPSSE